MRPPCLVKGKRDRTKEKTHLRPAIVDGAATLKICGLGIMVVFLVGIFCTEPKESAAEGAGEYYIQGTGYLREGKLDEAISALTEAVSREPACVDAYSNRALSYYEQKKYAEAEADFLKAVKLKPNDSKVNNNLGIYFYGQGDDEKALFYLHRALALNERAKPWFADIYRNLSAVYVRKGMYQEAADAYERAATLTGTKPANSFETRLVHENPSFDQRGYDSSGNEPAMTVKFYKN